jgi:hypothetical protein
MKAIAHGQGGLMHSLNAKITGFSCLRRTTEKPSA